jgi:UDP-N-acetylmuramoyl-L-alanyl-D-glutamate--2,6-diaminopimelate ligase
MSEQRSVALDTLLRTLDEGTHVTGTGGVRVNQLAIDSREVVPGGLFIALRGEHTDGHRFIAQAIKRGALGIIAEEHHATPQHVTLVVVPDTARALSTIADAFYGSPSKDLLVTGITGTNGKTTTSQMTAAILSAAGLPCGTIGTVGAHLGEREWQLSNTTPLAPQLHELLADMRERGAKSVAMEVSSHALALHRVDDVRFEVGALTNVSRDHLDFHKSFDSYAGAKRKLFNFASRCVFNVDDELGERWSRELRKKKNVVTYAMRNAADIRSEKLHVRPDGSSFEVQGQRYEVRIPGRFNVANAMCALGIARQLQIRDADAAAGLASLQRVAGRMERVEGKESGITIIVDYAHTPDALENVLKTLREATKNQLIVVFGCGGDRDRGKRPQMGAVASRYADVVYITSDNPRTEEPMAIMREIAAGAEKATLCQDRRAAILGAVRSSMPGDVVLIAGKGHENYQIIGTDVLPFDDVSVAREALAARSAQTENVG